MKIVHITWDDIGGVGQMCLSLQKSFIEMGLGCTINPTHFFSLIIIQYYAN